MTGLRAQRKAATREAIVATAMRLFDERGIAGTSMDDIADAVGVSRATVFNYFAYKEAILVEIGARFVGGIAEAAGARRRRSPRLILHDLADAVADIAERHPGLVAQVAREMTHPDAGRRRYAQERMGYPMLYNALLQKLREEGRLRHPGRLASYGRQLVDLTTGVLVRAGTDFPMGDLRAELHANVDLFWSGAVINAATAPESAR